MTRHKFKTVIIEKGKPNKSLTRAIKAVNKQQAWQLAKILFPGCHVVSIGEPEKIEEEA